MKTVAVLRRRAWVVVAAALLGAIGASLVVSGQQTTHTARAVVVVPVFEPEALDADDGRADDGGADDPFLGRPLDASRLALTYAALMVEDLAILEVVAAETDQVIDDVAEAVTIENTPDTPLIEIVATAEDPEVATAMLTSFVGALTAPEPSTPSIAPGSLQIVRIEEPEASTSTELPRALGAGLLFGGAVGIVVAVFWERSQPRLDTAPEVSTLLGVPARDTRQITSGSGTWILQRWAELAGKRRSVLIVACPPLKLSEATAAGMELADTLEVTAVSPSQSNLANTPDDDPDHVISPIKNLEIAVPDPNDDASLCHLLIEATHPPGTDNDSRSSGKRSGIVVLAVSRGTLAADVVDTVETLTTAGISPRWAILHG